MVVVWRSIERKGRDRIGRCKVEKGMVGSELNISIATMRRDGEARRMSCWSDRCSLTFFPRMP